MTDVQSEAGVLVEGGDARTTAVARFAMRFALWVAVAAFSAALMWETEELQAELLVPTPTTTSDASLTSSGSPLALPTVTPTPVSIWESESTNSDNCTPGMRCPRRAYDIRRNTLTATPLTTPTSTVEEGATPTSTTAPTATPGHADMGGFVITTPGPAVTIDATAAHMPRPSTTAFAPGELPSFLPPELDAGSSYTVQEGDTLWSVAIEMGLDLDEVICAVAPDFSVGQPLVVGDRLEAPGRDVRCHRVQEGESPLAIAALYGVDVRVILAEPWNRIAPNAADEILTLDRYVRVPAGVLGQAQRFTDESFLNPPSVNPIEADRFLDFMLQQPVNVSPYLAYAVGGPRAQRPCAGPSAALCASQDALPANWPYGSGQFTWPVFGWLSQGYRNDHRAIDIAAQTGTFVAAADRGVVIRAGWNQQGYGQFVVIDHNIDYITLYAHLEQVLVKEGEVVGQGQIIGTVGSTGNSTGPHLHFEIRDFGRRVNPIELLVR